MGVSNRLICLRIELNGLCEQGDDILCFIECGSLLASCRNINLARRTVLRVVVGFLDG
jgi:hypothetical protein